MAEPLRPPDRVAVPRSKPFRLKRARLPNNGHKKERWVVDTALLHLAGILLFAALLWGLRGFFPVPPDQRNVLFFWIFGAALALYLMTVHPLVPVGLAVWTLMHSLYRIRVAGRENIPLTGPALLVSNHVSHVDGLILGVCVKRQIRFLLYRDYYELKALHWFFRLIKAIPISSQSTRGIVESLKKAREELLQGNVVCIFPEGAVTRTGHLLPFKRGFEKLAEDLDVPVIPVYLDRLWGSIFSFKGGRFFWKRPERIPYPVTVLFGKAMPPDVKVEKIRERIIELGGEAAQYRREPGDLLHLRFLRTAKRRWFSFCMADSSGRELSYGKTLTASLLLSRWIRKQCKRDSMVGVLLPPSVGGALANIGLLLAGKVAVNLNFTLGREALASAVQQCGIRAILTSRPFLARAKLEELEGMVFLEDVMKLRPLQKAVMGFLAFVLPSRLIERLFAHRARDPNAPATVIFSSGSTGDPKGIVLSHHNILSNVEGIAQVVRVTRKDRLMGVLPFFHSFGFTVTLWFPLLSGFGVVYHPNPLDAKTIGEMVFRYKASLLVGTPTFFGAYVRRCSREEFSSLRYALVGAEKLREPLARAFKEKYGIELFEGYGCTELSPVVSANVPDVEHDALHQIGFKPGTVGHPIPGVAVKVVSPDTRTELSPGEEGLILVKGPGVMLGYLGKPEETTQVLSDGWYVTGDIGSIDVDGFIRVTDRLSRFSKMGGEMVPHLRVEEEINQILREGSCLVTSLPDEQKGERLAVLYTDPSVSPEELWSRLSKTQLPRLWIPKRENFHRVDAIPLLGTGKVDLRKAKTIVMDMEKGLA